MGSIFKFKQFEIDQADCAMKINTDGVLLGSLVELAGAKHLLDIGTGTGVIAMMLAQREQSAMVDAVDIDEAAAKRAAINFENSPFKNRLDIFHCSFDELDEMLHYDVIVSNPPFFMNSLQNPDARKTVARHTDYLFFDKLLRFANLHLKDNGRLSVIVPIDVANYMIAGGQQAGLQLIHKIEIRSFVDTEVIRNIITLSKTQDDFVPTIQDFVIYSDKGIYSDAYKAALQPFFLAF